MKKIILSLIAALTLGCATVPAAKPVVAAPTDDELVCKAAAAQVEFEKNDSNKDPTETVHFDVVLNSCQVDKELGLGIAVYQVIGHIKENKLYMGHMKRLMVFKKDEKGVWELVKEGTMFFIPPQTEDAPEDKGTSL